MSSERESKKGEPTPHFDGTNDDDQLNRFLKKLKVWFHLHGTKEKDKERELALKLTNMKRTHSKNYHNGYRQNTKEQSAMNLKEKRNTKAA